MSKRTTLGVLNLFSRHAHAFDDEAEHVGLLFATHAAIAYAAVQRFDQLDQALSTRDIVGQAKGILMERFNINRLQAFSVLTRISQTTNKRLRVVASQLVTNRQLPGAADTRPPLVWDPGSSIAYHAGTRPRREAEGSVCSRP